MPFVLAMSGVWIVRKSLTGSSAASESTSVTSAAEASAALA